MADVGEAAARYRAASTGVDRTAAREVLAAAVRQATIPVLRKRLGARGADIDDLAQDICLAVLDAIEREVVEPGKEDAFVKRVAFNKAMTLLNPSRGRRDPMRRAHSLTMKDGSVRDPELEQESVLEAAERGEGQRERDADAAMIREILATAPKKQSRYATTITALYVEGGTHDDLLRAELESRGLDATDPRELRKARAVVDKLVSNARAWVRRELAKRKVGES